MSEPKGHLSRAVELLRAGKSLSVKLITDLIAEGHDVVGLARSIKPDASYQGA